jgi:hypothetical protein
VQVGFYVLNAELTVKFFVEFADMFGEKFRETKVICGRSMGACHKTVTPGFFGKTLAILHQFSNHDQPLIGKPLKRPF